MEKWRTKVDIGSLEEAWKEKKKGKRNFNGFLSSELSQSFFGLFAYFLENKHCFLECSLYSFSGWTTCFFFFFWPVFLNFSKGYSSIIKYFFVLQLPLFSFIFFQLFFVKINCNEQHISETIQCWCIMITLCLGFFQFLKKLFFEPDFHTKRHHNCH